MRPKRTSSARKSDSSTAHQSTESLDKKLVFDGAAVPGIWPPNTKFDFTKNYTGKGALLMIPDSQFGTAKIQTRRKFITVLRPSVSLVNQQIEIGKLLLFRVDNLNRLIKLIIL
jgi:hypothetical protein